MGLALILTYSIISFPAYFHRTTIAPNDRISYRFPFLIHQDQTVHLIGDPYTDDLIGSNIVFLFYSMYPRTDLLPPIFGILLCPSIFQGDHFHFRFGLLYYPDTLSGSYFYQGYFNGRTPDIQSQIIHIRSDPYTDDLIGSNIVFLFYSMYPRTDLLPPIFGILLCPSIFQGDHFHFRFGLLYYPDTLSGSYFYQGYFNGRTPDIQSQIIHILFLFQ